MRSHYLMSLILLLSLAAVPLLGVVYIAFFGTPFSVDGLFTGLILLAMSGIMGMTALFELRKGKAAFAMGRSAGFARAAYDGRLVQRGKVEEVVFFESHVGQPNKSIVTLSDGQAARTLVLEGDMRNALPVGQRVQIFLRKEAGQNVLADVSYS